MAVQLVLRKGTDAENDSFTGADAEVTVDVTNKTLRVHDGTTTGGFQTASVAGSQTLENKTLSSPEFTGQITGDLIPSDDVTYDLGSSSNRWKDLFLSGNTIDIGGATISVTNGSFEFKDSSGNDAEVSLAANTTDDLSEGSSNLYYTDTRVRNAVSVSGDLSYDSSTGTFSFTERTDSEVRELLSASGDLSYDSATGEFSVTTYKSSDFDSDFSGKDTDDLSEGTGNLYHTDSRARGAVSASGDLSYDSATGEFSFTERTDSEVRNLFSAAGDLSYDNATGEFSVTTYKSADFDSDFGNKSSDDLSEGTTNLYYTDTRVDSHLSGGTGVSYSSGTISIGQPVGTSDNVEFNDVVVAGDLTVSGTTTTVNTETLDVADNNITLNSNYSGSSPTENGGITVNRGTESDVVLQWNETNDHWEIESGGTTGRILTTGDEGSGNGLDVDLLDGEQGSYYLNYNNFTNTPSNLSDFSNDENYIKLTDLSASSDLNYNSSTGEFSVTTYKSSDFDSDFSGKTTSDLSEGTNLYYTDSRVDSHLSGGNAIDYNAGTISVPSNAIGTDELDVSGTGSAGEALLSDGDGSFSFGAAGATITDDESTDSSFYPTLTDSTSGSFTAATVSSTKLFFNPSSGTLNATAFNSLSDERTKKNIQTLDFALDKTMSLRGVSYTFKDTEVDSIGLIAQELEQVIPEVVSTGEDGLKSVSYGNLVGLLIEAIKDQQNQIDELKNKVYK